MNSSCVVIGAFVSPIWQMVIIECVVFLLAAFLPPNQGVGGQIAGPELIGFKSGALELKRLCLKTFRGRLLSCLAVEPRKREIAGIGRYRRPVFRQHRICFFAAPSRAGSLAEALHHG